MLSAFQLISEFQITLRKPLFIVIVEVELSDLEQYGIERSGRSRASAHPSEHINSPCTFLRSPAVEADKPRAATNTIFSADSLICLVVFTI